MNLIKTSLVQPQENSQEIEDMLELINNYKSKINQSFAVPAWLLSENKTPFDLEQRTEIEWYSVVYPLRKPRFDMIDIDVTKLP